MHDTIANLPEQSKWTNRKDLSTFTTVKLGSITERNNDTISGIVESSKSSKTMMPPQKNDKLITDVLKYSPKKEEREVGNKGTIEESGWLERPLNHPIIYMRRLDPEICTEFSTEKGKEVFKHAMKEKYMNTYFVLSPYFHTQCETNLCAVGTLVMVLNALKVDPRRMWKYPWRWYDEYMLNTCMDLEEMMSKGCSFDVFVCIARCNKLSVEAVRVSPEISIDMLR